MWLTPDQTGASTGLDGIVPNASCDYFTTTPSLFDPCISLGIYVPH